MAYEFRSRPSSDVEMAASSAPTTELGTALNELRNVAPASAALRMGGKSAFGLTWQDAIQDVMEHVPDLMWAPNGAGAVGQYHLMRTDAQAQALYMGSTLPIRRYGFFLEPNGANDRIVSSFSQDSNIPIRGKEDQPQGRRQGRFDVKEHLRIALLALIYGHMYFEQVGTIGSDGLWHMKKLGPRMPQSIQEIGLEDDGGLSYIVQRGMGVTSGGRQRRIDISRLVAYVWEREGANWTGRSMFRGIYKNFLLKDTTLRVGAINIERAGGVPVITGPKGATPEDLAELGKMARQFRVGANAGGAIPNGAELNLARAAGGEEAVNYIKLQNEEMARGWLMMFLTLGQNGNHGSYAMSDSFVDYALNTQEVIAQWFCDIYNQYVIEDYVTWNFGDDEQCPLLVYKRTDDRQLAIADLVNLIETNVITVDDELESWIREDYRMPRRDPNATPRSPSSAVGSPGPAAATEVPVGGAK